MVVGAVLDEEGRPVCSGQWPGNESDQAALLEVVDRTRQRFDLREVAWVTDRGMISAKTIQGLEERGLRYILGARMRSQKEVREEVLARPGRYHEVAPNLLVKEKDDQWYILRTPLQGVSGKVLQAVGVAPPPPCGPCGAKASA